MSGEEGLRIVEVGERDANGHEEEPRGKWVHLRV